MDKVFATKLASEAGIEGRQLVTRPMGKRFGRRLLEVVALPSPTCLVLSFEGVDLMDASFADEALAALAAARSRRMGPAGCLVLSDLGAASFENVVLALLSRPVREPGLRNCVLPIVTAEGWLQLVGKAEDHVRHTFETLCSRRQLTARDLAESEGLEIGAASTRLKVLFDLGLARRHECRDDRGRLYTYTSVQ